jgi:AraC-like DNA-binding protein
MTGRSTAGAALNTEHRTPNTLLDEGPRHMQRFSKSEWLRPSGPPIRVQSGVRHPDGQPMHDHEFDELVLVTGGAALHTAGGHSWPIAAGDVFVIKGDCPHEYTAARDLTIVNVLYDTTRLALPLEDLPAMKGYQALFRLEPHYRPTDKFESRLRLSDGELKRALELVNTLNAELTRPGPGSRFMAVAAFMQLIGFLSRCYEASAATHAPRNVMRMAEAIAHLEQNYTKPLDIGELAQKACLSRRHFQRVFRQAVGESPLHCILRLRIQHAAGLLEREPNPRVDEVARAAGFTDSNYFSRLFRRHMGVSPRRYARRPTGA